MIFSQDDRERLVRWCDEQVPERVRHQVIFDFTTRGASVTLVERRAPWDGVGDWTARPFAQLRQTGDLWRLYWPDRNTRWYLREEFPAGSLAMLLDVVADPRNVFLG